MKAVAIGRAAVYRSARIRRGPPAELTKAVQARLAALARAHELTRPGLIDTEQWPAKATTLHTLVQTIFAPYLDPQCSSRHKRTTVSGPYVPIGEQPITNFALILHELATNAAKYGALSSSTGTVNIDCSVGGGELLIIWQESGGPPLAGQPKHEGFGALLTRETVTTQFGGQVSYAREPEGLTVYVSVCLQKLAM